MTEPQAAPAAARVHLDDTLVLEVTDRPGVLLSTAAPPPEGAPDHPFVDARAFDPFTEGTLAGILGESSNYQDFLDRLTEAGFRVEPVSPD